MPTYLDPEGSTVTASVDLGSASSFVTYSSGKFTIKPVASATSQSYTVTVKITDESGAFTTGTF